MSFETILFLGLGAVVGGFINGLAGTGTALFALGFLLLVLEPTPAVAVIALLSVLASVQGVWMVRHQIVQQPRRLLRFLIPGLVGVPIGGLLLVFVDASMLRIGIGVLLLSYGSYFGFRSALPALTRPTPVADSAIGFAGGVLGAAALAGTLPTMWMSLRPWSKAETRAVLQPYNFIILSVAICLLIGRGAYDGDVLKALVITLPIGLIAAQVGIWVFKRISDTAFRRLLVLMTFGTGGIVLLSELL